MAVYCISMENNMHRNDEEKYLEHFVYLIEKELKQVPEISFERNRYIRQINKIKENNNYLKNSKEVYNLAVNVSMLNQRTDKKLTKLLLKLKTDL